MEYIDHVRTLNDTTLADEVLPLAGLGGVMAWMTRHGVPLSAVVIVQQDEFSLDFLVPWKDGRSIAFGIT